MTRLVPEIRFRLRIVLGDDIAIGPGKIDLLEAIGAQGSITAAAKALGMSYRRAWLLVDTMNRCFETPVVTTEAGGVSGGGTRLTPAGKEVVRRYRRMEAKVEKACADDLAAVTPLLKQSVSEVESFAQRCANNYTSDTDC
jgi:molybdate transport system regulatory protein